MSKDEDIFPFRTIVLFVIVVPIVVYLLQFAYKKNKESSSRAQECQQQCEAQGRDGYEFHWNVLSGPRCECL